MLTCWPTDAGIENPVFNRIVTTAVSGEIGATLSTEQGYRISFSTT